LYSKIKLIEIDQTKFTFDYQFIDKFQNSNKIDSYFRPNEY